MAVPELIIFDCDGVLVDSEIIACRTDAACLTEIGFPISADEIAHRYIGVSAATKFADIEARFGRALPLDFGVALKQRLAAAFEADLKMIAGIDSFTDHITCNICVASSSDAARIKHSLSLTGLLPRFHPHIFSATQVARGKPAPDLFLFAAHQMLTEPRACLVIEDSAAGVQAAVAAGMRVIGFTAGGHCRPGHGETLRALGAFAICNDSKQLLELLTLVSGSDHSERA